MACLLGCLLDGWLAGLTCVTPLLPSPPHLCTPPCLDDALMRSIPPFSHPRLATSPERSWSAAVQTRQLRHYSACAHIDIHLPGETCVTIAPIHSPVWEIFDFDFDFDFGGWAGLDHGDLFSHSLTHSLTRSLFSLWGEWWVMQVLVNYECQRWSRDTVCMCCLLSHPEGFFLVWGSLFFIPRLPHPYTPSPLPPVS